eukprot:1139699-Pelagomonas_calceolata.AAC.3
MVLECCPSPCMAGSHQLITEQSGPLLTTTASDMCESLPGLCSTSPDLGNNCLLACFGPFPLTLSPFLPYGGIDGFS